MDLRLKIISYKEEMMVKIANIYKGFTLPAFVAGFIAWVFLMIFSISKNRRGSNEPYLVISTFVMGLFISRFMLLVMMDATESTPAMGYVNSEYLFIYVFSFLMLYWTFKQCKKIISQRAIKN